MAKKKKKKVRKSHVVLVRPEKKPLSISYSSRNFLFILSRRRRVIYFYFFPKCIFLKIIFLQNTFSLINRKYFLYPHLTKSG